MWALGGWGTVFGLDLEGIGINLAVIVVMLFVGALCLLVAWRLGRQVQALGRSQLESLSRDNGYDNVEVREVVQHLQMRRALMIGAAVIAALTAVFEAIAIGVGHTNF